MAFHGSLPGQASQALGAPFFTSNLMSVGMLPGVERPMAEGTLGGGAWARAASLAAAALLVLLPVVSYVNNYLQFSNTRQAVETLVDEGHTGGVGHVASLHSIEALADMLVDLDKDSQQATYLNAHMGMNQSTDLVQKLRRLYLTSIRDRVVAPLLAGDVQRMQTFVTRYKLPQTPAKTAAGKKHPFERAPAGEDDEDDEEAGPPTPDEQEYATFFDLLKTHLMCTTDTQEPSEPDAPSNAWLVTSLARRWGKAAGEATDEARTSERLQGHVAAYVDAVRTDPTLRLMRRAPLVTAVRNTLMRAPEEVAVMALLTDGMERYTLSLVDLLGDEQAPVHTDEKIPGAYTRAGWENVVRARMAQGGSDTEGLWVLGAEGVAQRRAFLEASSADVRDVIYWHNYGNAWHAFVVSLRLSKGPQEMDGKEENADVGAGKTPTQKLAADYPMAYQRLLQAVKYNLEPAPKQDMRPSAADL